MFNKKQRTETDIRTKYITLAISSARGDIQNQMKEESNFTDRRIIVRKSGTLIDSVVTG